MTKEEVRAVVASKLSVRENDVVYDVGSGTGSIAVEIATRLSRGRVYAIESNPKAIELIRANAVRFGAGLVFPVNGSAPAALVDLPAPDRVFIGGSSGEIDGIVDEVLSRNPQVRIVLTAVTIEGMTGALAAFESRSLDVEIVQISVSKSDTIGRYHMMKAQNPIYVISAGKR
jgi:precorrin-6Y C5,15-methyltransferase (decarboxylating)